MIVGTMLISTVSAQDEKDYSVTSKEAFKHANAHMIRFVESNITDFKEWEGASIDTKPLELYDINGKKLFYQFSVSKNNNIIGKIDIGADKTLGQSVQVIEFNPKPFDAAEAMKKSIEIARNEYPDGEVKLTRIVVYSYPSIGAMTVVKDKITGNEYRIFVDVYSLDEVEDKPPTETELGVWSMYEQISKNKIDENLKEWNESDQRTKSVDKEATGIGINISTSITEEKMEKLIANAAVASTGTSVYLNVPRHGQEASNYCAPTCGQMIAERNGVYYSQAQIYAVMGGTGGGITYPQQVSFYQSPTSSGGLGKTNSYSTTTISFSTATYEIDHGRPFVSGNTYHVRVCRGYSTVSGNYLAINDPLPVGSTSGSYYMEQAGSSSDTIRIYVK